MDDEASVITNVTILFCFFTLGFNTEDILLATEGWISNVQSAGPIAYWNLLSLTRDWRFYGDKFFSCDLLLSSPESGRGELHKHRNNGGKREES